jgi:ribosomal protein L44E
LPRAIGHLDEEKVLIHHTCYKCKRRFELDPVFVGFELGKLKKKDPNHYQAICPACRAVNKVSVEQMQAELDGVAEEVGRMVAEYEQKKTEERAARQASAAEKKAKAQKK